MRRLRQTRRRAWTRFRSLEDWAQASITCATIALAFLGTGVVDALVTGDRRWTLWEAILSVFLIYAWCLMAWSAWYHQRHVHDPNYPEHSSPLRRLAPRSLRRMAMVAIAVEVIALSAGALLTMATAPVRHLARRGRADENETPDSPR